MTHYKLVCPNADDLVLLDDPANRGYVRGEIVELLAADAAASGDTYEIVDGSALSGFEIDDLYASALLALADGAMK